MAWIAVSIVGGVTAGALMSRGGGGSSSPTYVENDYGQTLKESLTDQIDIAPDLFQAESNTQFGRPAYARLEQELVRNSLLGDQVTYDSQGREITGYSTGADDFAITETGSQDRQRRVGTRNGGMQLNDGVISGGDPVFNVKGRGMNLPFSSKEKAEEWISKQKDEAVYRQNADGETIYIKPRANETVGTGGSVGLMAGNQMTEYYDGKGKRKAGFDNKGNFQGVNQLDADLKFRQQSDSLKQTTLLADKYGDELTDALRTDDMSSAISGFKDLANKDSSNQSIVGSGGRYDKARELSSGIGGISGSSIAGGGQATNVYRAGIGDLNGLRSGLANDALSELRTGGNLSAQELRQVEQDARASQTARGVSRNFSSVVDEVANKESLRRERQNESRAYAQSVGGMEAGMRGQEVSTDMQAQMANQGASQDMLSRGLQAQMANAQFGQQAQMANQQRDMQGMAQQLTGFAQDSDEDLAIQNMNRQFNMQSLQSDRASRAQLIGIEQATSADPFMAITGRNFTGSQGGQNVYGNGQSAINATPNLYNPSQGAEFIANQTAGQNNFNANLYSADQQAKAGMYSGLAGMTGTIASAGLKYCWVAREVYGEDNPMWLLFRDWLDTEAPSWFKATYLKFGERFAKFIKNKPRFKKVIRNWMTSKIKEVI